MPFHLKRRSPVEMRWAKARRFRRTSGLRPGEESLNKLTRSTTAAHSEFTRLAEEANLCSTKSAATKMFSKTADRYQCSMTSALNRRDLIESTNATHEKSTVKRVSISATVAEGPQHSENARKAALSATKFAQAPSSSKQSICIRGLADPWVRRRKRRSILLNVRAFIAK